MAPDPSTPNTGILFYRCYGLRPSDFRIPSRLYHEISAVEVLWRRRNLNFTRIACLTETSSPGVHVVFWLDCGWDVPRYQWVGKVVETHIHTTRSKSQELPCHRNCAGMAPLPLWGRCVSHFYT